MADGEGSAPPAEGEEQKRGRGRPRIELPEIDFGDNSIEEVIAAVEEAFDEIAKAASQREKANKTVQSVRDKLFGIGIPKEAFDLCRAYINWPDDKKRNFDIAFAICRKAAGAPIQRDLFDNLD
jgi:hypothetical protein